MNYEAERAMNQKRLRMEGEPGHGVIQGNGLPLNYMDNGHQIPYQPYANAYNTHYPPPEAFAAYGPPPPGSYAPQNLSYVPPAHQNYPHHQSFPQQPPQAQLHMPQSHMGKFMVQGYGAEIGIHKAGWPPQHLLPPLDTQKPLDIKQLKPEIKLEPTEAQKRPHPDNEIMSGDLDQPKIKIKTDIFKPDDLPHKVDTEKPIDLPPVIADIPKPPELLNKDESQLSGVGVVKPVEQQLEATKVDALIDKPGESRLTDNAVATGDKIEVELKPFSSPEQSKPVVIGKPVTPGSEPKKRGRPKGSTNKPKPAGAARTPGGAVRAAGPAPGPARTAPVPASARPRAPPGYQYAIRPFRKDFSGIQFRRRWSDECLDSSHIPNEVYFGDVPVSAEVLHNYYDANAERERLAAQAAHIAAQKAAAAKLAAARPRNVMPAEVTTVDSSSSDEDSESGSDSDDSDEDQPLKAKVRGRPKGSKNSLTPKSGSGTAGGGAGGGGGGRRGRPPVPPELREHGITDMKKFCKAAGIRFDYKKLVEGCTKNKERVAKMMELLVTAGLEGKPTLEKCQALKQAKQDKKLKEKQAKKEAKVKHKEDDDEDEPIEGEKSVSRRMTRGATGVKPRQRIVISSDEEDDTPAARRTLSKLRGALNDHSDSD